MGGGQRGDARSGVCRQAPFGSGPPIIFHLTTHFPHARPGGNTRRAFCFFWGGKVATRPLPVILRQVDPHQPSPGHGGGRAQRRHRFPTAPAHACIKPATTYFQGSRARGCLQRLPCAPSWRTRARRLASARRSLQTTISPPRSGSCANQNLCLLVF